MLGQRRRRWANIETALGEWPWLLDSMGGGPRVVVSTAAFLARVRGSFPVSAVWKKHKYFFPIHV